MVKFNLIFLATVLSLSSCAATEYRLNFPNRKVRLTPYTEKEGFRLERRFDVRVVRHNFFWGLVTNEELDLETILNKKTGPGEVVGNLSISERYRGGDGLLDFLTIGLYRPYTVRVTGDVFVAGHSKPTKLRKEAGR